MAQENDLYGSGPDGINHQWTRHHHPDGIFFSSYCTEHKHVEEIGPESEKGCGECRTVWEVRGDWTDCYYCPKCGGVVHNPLSLCAACKGGE